MSTSESDDLTSENSDNDSHESDGELDIEEPNPEPKDIKSVDPFTDISFHPKLCTSLAAADISGYIRL